MAFRSFSLAAATGFACSLLRGKSSQTASCETANNKSDRTAVNRRNNDTPVPIGDAATCKCVIVGGGFAGSKAAYFLDSLFDVTLIDEKNFYEMSFGVIPLLTQQWNEVEGDAMNSAAQFKKLSSVHRYYLKRANVLTGTAENVTENEVVLADGRRIPYDLLILATGGQKSFPFHSSQRTLAGRIDEIKNFNQFLRNKCQKVAIIGGGPAGVSLAASLVEQQPEKDVVLFHSHNELLPKMPKSVRVAAHNSLTSMRENTAIRKRLFSKFVDEGKQSAADTGSFSLKLNHRVNDVQVMPGATTTIVARPVVATPSDGDDEAKTPKAAGGSLFGGLFGSSSVSSPKTQTFKDVPLKYRVIADELDTLGGDTVAQQQKLLESRSILHRLYFGDSVPASSLYSGVVGNKGATTSALTDDEDLLARDVRTKIDTIKRENISFDDFDYVFDLRGTVPRPIIRNNAGGAAPSPPNANILNEHVLPDGKYRSSLLFQLLGRPNIFAIGKCNNMPWVNSMGMSDSQIKALFGELIGVLFADPTNPKMLKAADDGLNPKKMLLPKLMIPLGNFEATGYSVQKGAVSGASAMLEIKADREYLMREFLQPLFFKQRNQQEARHRIMCWMNEEVTDITDFSF